MQDAVQARCDLIIDAIKTFHKGVSDDFLLKGENSKELRDRLLKSAADFYGKLGALLCKETDMASRRALAASNFELADSTGKVGRNEDALAAHRVVLAAREALAEVERSLREVARLLEAMGKPEEALATYRRSESLLAGLADSNPTARAALATCRMRMGWLLSRIGRNDEALGSLHLARAHQETRARAPGVSAEARADLSYTANAIGLVIRATGKPTEAEAEHRASLALRQKLADDNPKPNPLITQPPDAGPVLRSAGLTVLAPSSASRRSSFLRRNPRPRSC